MSTSKPQKTDFQISGRWLPIDRRFRSFDSGEGKYKDEKIHLLRDDVVFVGAFDPCGVG